LIVDRRLLPYVDWPLIAALLALMAVGLATIYSVTFDATTGTASPQFWAQLYAIPVGLLALAVCMAVDYRSLAQRSWLLYTALLLALVFVMFFGVVRGGARRWIALPGFSLQPSELARLVVALVLASFYGEWRRSARRLPELMAGLAIVAGPFLLIASQPDLGTAAMLLPVLAGVMFLGGLRLKWIWTAALIFVLLSPVIWTYGLQEYQRERVITFVDPSRDPQDAGYQQLQARITVGSGGFYGKGFMEGTQGQGGFLPVAHNDFVFAILAEEHGFIGVLAAMGLYLFVIVRALDAARLAGDRVGTFLVVAIVAGFGCQVLYNITMSAGLAPVKGLPLPLMSYGGSSLVATLAGFGLILNVRMRRFTN